MSTHSLDPCLWGGVSDHPDFGPTASISLHLASNSNTPAGSVHKSRGDSVVCMWVQLKRWCVSCVCVCVLQLREGDFVCSEFGKGATSEEGKSLFRAANV